MLSLIYNPVCGVQEQDLKAQLWRDGLSALGTSGSYLCVVWMTKFHWHLQAVTFSLHWGSLEWLEVLSSAIRGLFQPIAGKKELS